MCINCLCFPFEYYETLQNHYNKIFTRIKCNSFSLKMFNIFIPNYKIIEFSTEMGRLIGFKPKQNFKMSQK